MTACTDKTYQNAGNPPLLKLVDPAARRLLDVGCGAGDNARVLAAERSDLEVYGITVSSREREQAEQHMATCWVADVERDPLDFLRDRQFDVVFLSHVLEHLVDPAAALTRLLEPLRPGGQVLIAVPNIAYWSYRLRILRGRFDYEDAGAFDRTHLHFYTMDSAPRELVEPVPGLELVQKSADGFVPLWLLRRHVLPPAWSARADAVATRLWPGLFAGQILLECRKS